MISSPVLSPQDSGIDFTMRDVSQDSTEPQRIPWAEKGKQRATSSSSNQVEQPISPLSLSQPAGLDQYMMSPLFLAHDTTSAAIKDQIILGTSTEAKKATATFHVLEIPYTSPTIITSLLLNSANCIIYQPL